MEVHVSYPTINAYPLVHATPNASTQGAWWIANRSDTGFDIIMETAQTHDVEFTWMVTAMRPGTYRFLSDGTNVAIDNLTAQPYGPMLPVTDTSTSTSSTSDQTTTSTDIAPPPEDTTSTPSTSSDISTTGTTP